MYVSVLIDITHQNVDKLFDYYISDSLFELVSVGSRVIVPFGNQKRVGFVYEIKKESSLATREVIDVIDLNPVLNDESFAILNYLENFNDKTLSKLVQTIIPSELMFSYLTLYEVVSNNIDEELLLITKKDRFINNDLITNKHKRLIYEEINNNNIKVHKTYSQKARQKLIDKIYFNPFNINEIKDIDTQFINFIKKNPGLTRLEITNNNHSISKVTRLLKNKTLIIKKEREYRLPNYEENDNIVKVDKLNIEQLEASNKFINTNKKISLLYGITSSGKTEVYISAIKDMINKNKKILFLVPDVSLIYQTYLRLKLEEELNVVIFHSQLSKGSRFDAIDAINSSEANVLLGTRSSVFLNIDSLGLIILDEEHDDGYIQTQDVFYEVLEIAKIKAQHNNAKILLGSATPSITSYYKALNNEYELLIISKRAVVKKEPKLHIVDMKEELKLGNTSIISNKLNDLIINKLNKKEQVLILFNQKGYAPFVMCRSCGYVAKDPNTNMSLLYDKNNNKLKSRQTKYEEDYSVVCKRCNENAFMPVGIGIDYVYDVFKKTYKNANVKQIKANTFYSKKEYESLMKDIYSGNVDIIVGTKAISKGLDFKKVTLSVILMADTLFSIPNYLASQSAYMTIRQMIGRSGRHLNGDALVQTYQPNHFSITTLNNYNDFYIKALEEREIRKFEPFYKTYQVIFYGNKYLNTYKAAFSFMKKYLEDKKIVLGPTEILFKKQHFDFGFIVTIKFNKEDIIDFKEMFDSTYKDVYINVLPAYHIL